MPNFKISCPPFVIFALFFHRGVTNPNQATMEEVHEVVIVGAGVSGLATALGLHRKGIRTLVLESSDSLRAAGFALLTWSNAWKALDALGVGDLLRQTHVPLQRLVIHSAISGAVSQRQQFWDGRQRMQHEVRAVRRNQLLEALAKELPPNTIRFSSKVVSIEEEGRLKLLHLADGSTLKTKALVGSDGVNSVVAKWLGFRNASFSGRWACRGLAGFSKDYILKHQFIQYFFGNGFRAGIMPCDEKTVYWFFTWTPTDQEKEAEEDTVKIRELILARLKNSKVPKDVIEAIEGSDMGAMIPAPLKFRMPLHLLRWNICKDNVCVTGDALHPMTPDLGQGGCSALEDAVVLVRCLAERWLVLEVPEGEAAVWDYVQDSAKVC
ncbi:Zeaxanthin epoxidase, chloroplastic [Apostasia shenzhenica]|uniref:Zeaxanthin epoxidase, chloroplastic n=1 Tax=Apostasia shenzhenica TaxID=1088818 RepID=A0A2I0AXY0_9ASPA|nr:Zeaxanthin epoxidase, chloroplastic [Apostasia shenzhenica]